jgi:serine/threonine protein kinase
MSYKNESKSEGKSGDDEHSNELSSWQHIDFKDIELGQRIGGGGIGVIYKGWWKDEQVALKTIFDSRISGDLKNEYMDELIVMSKVKHSNIVDFKGACMTPPNFLFVMEMCECSLHDILHVKREFFSERENVNMLIDIASALEYLHSQKPAIIHRDIKTLNILRSFEGPLKLCDFGLVKVQNTRAGMRK